MSAGNSFFALLNIALSENSRETNKFQDGPGAEQEVPKLDIEKDNEWMQEYHIIYNSYILDDTESARTTD